MTQQRYCATAPLRNSATALSPTAGICAAGNRVGICAACRGQLCRGKLYGLLDGTTTTALMRHDLPLSPRFGGSFATIKPSIHALEGASLTFLLSFPPSPFCKAQQQRNRSLILDPHLRSSIHSALRNSATAQ